MKTPAVLLAIAFALGAVQARAQPVETELGNVTADLIELRQAGGLTRLAVRFTNGGEAEEDSTRYPAGRITLVDVKTKKKCLPLKDANGQFIAGPIGDWIEGGRIRLLVPARRSTVVWAYFDAVAAGTVVNVEMPSVFPFEDVAVTNSSSQVFSSGAAKSTPGGATATVVSARRANEVLNVRLRFEPEKGATVDLGSPYFEYKDVFLFDPIGKRKYPLLKDTEGNFQGQPLTVKSDGGSFILDWDRPTLVSLRFPAPPDTVRTADLFLHQFLPVEGVAIEGLGGAAAGASPPPERHSVSRAR